MKTYLRKGKGETLLDFDSENVNSERFKETLAEINAINYRKS